MSEVRGLKVKVGALLLLALALLVGFVVVLGDLRFGPQRTLHLELADSGSVLSGAPVKIAGVRAGKVTAVRFLDATARAEAARQARPGEPPVNVRLTLALDPELAEAIGTGATWVITTQGVLGEKYVEIVPGPPGTPAPAEGAVLRGQDPARIDVLFGRVDRVLAQVEAALGAEGGLPVGELVATLGRLAHNLDALLVANREHLDALLAGLPGAVTEARGLLAGLRAGVGDGAELRAMIHEARGLVGTVAAQAGPLTAEARQALAKAERTLSAGERLLTQADATLTAVRPDLQATATQAAAALKQIGPSAVRLDAVLHDTQWLLDHVRRGQGTVGALLVDQVIYDDLKAMLRDLKRNPWKFLWKE